MYTHIVEKNHRISKNYDGIWIQGNKYHKRKQAQNEHHYYLNNRLDYHISNHYLDYYFKYFKKLKLPFID